MSSNMLGMQTVSEVMQKELKRKGCPLIMECTKMINLFLFYLYCDSPNYFKCIEFSKRMGETNMPSGWLRILAVKKNEGPKEDEK